MESTELGDRLGNDEGPNKSLGKLWRLIPANQRPKFFVLTIFTLIGTSLEVVGIGMIVPLINLLTNDAQTGHSSVLEPIFRVFNATSQTQMLLIGLSIISFVVLVKNLFFVFISFYRFNLTSKIRASIENQLFNKYINSSYDFHLKTNSSLILRNITSEVDQVINNALIPLISMSVEIFVVIGLTSLLMIIEPIASLFLLLFFGVCGITYTKTIGPFLTRYGYEQARQRTELVKSTSEVLGGVKEIKLLGREHYFQEIFRKNTDKASRLSVLSSTLQNLPLLLVEVWGILGLVLVILVMVFTEHQSNQIVSVLGLFVGASFRFLPSLNRILVAVNGLRHVGPSIETLSAEVLTNGNSRSDNQLKLHFRKSLEFQNVSFSYNRDSAHVLNNVTFKIKSGEMLGILGPSGSGKSTFVDLLLGLLIPTKGKVLVDGNQVDLTKSTWMNIAGYVPQEIYLLDNSIRNNIAFGINPESICENRISSVLQMAQLNEFVSSLPIGLETPVGERGSRLSGGQRQRIGIARALYNQPSLLVLDEATSALDSHTENEIVELLEKIKSGLTIVIISHKVSTLKYCDRLMSIQDGKIVEIN